MSDADKFAKGVKRISKEIEKYAQGGEREDGVKLSNAINRLEDLTNSAELRGSPENESRWEACRALRQAKIAADDVAYHARVAGRNAEISRLTQESKQKSYQDPYGDVGYGNKYRVRKG